MVTGQAFLCRKVSMAALPIPKNHITLSSNCVTAIVLYHTTFVEKLQAMFLKIFFLTFILVAVASMVLAFAMMKNKKEEIVSTKIPATAPAEHAE